MSKVAANGPPDALLMFRSAERYRAAAKVLQQHQYDERDPVSAWPLLTVDAFGTELLFKCLYVIDEGRAPPRGREGHRLKWLFEQFSLATQLDIRERWLRDVVHHPVHQLRLNPDAPHMYFFEVLETISNTFESTRYLYETGGQRPPDWYYVDLLGDVVRSVILSHRQAWHGVEANGHSKGEA